jgi:benzil reductase ((S)-benzoin forming)
MDRLAIVTGTSRGIGAAVAERLLERGWDVVGIARHRAPIADPRYRHLNIDLENASALAETVERELGAIASDARWRRIALVNNAAVGSELGPVEAIDPRAMLRMSAVNWVAPTWLMGFVLRHTALDGALRIVNVSSGGAVKAFPGLADYCGSKAALRMTGLSLAEELDSDLRTTPAPRDTAILSYEPGTVDTAMQEAARTRPLSEYPWGGMFRTLHARGALVPPSAPATEIVDFLEGDGHSRFTERRLGRSSS